MLTFNLKKECFNKIKNGEKIHEYREEKYYWTSRIVNEIYKPKGKKQRKIFIDFFLTMIKVDFVFKPCVPIDICFMNGMLTEDKQPRMYAKLKSIKYIQNGLKTDLKINAPVYDFEFELIEE